MADRACTKRSYRSSIDAIAAAASFHNPKTMRAYECQWCSQWHLTSQPTTAIPARRHEAGKP